VIVVNFEPLTTLSIKRQDLPRTYLAHHQLESELLLLLLLLLLLSAGVAVTLGVLRAAEVGQATLSFFSGLLGSSKTKPPNAQ